MAKVAHTADREPALAGREFSAPKVKLAVLPPAHRVALRARPDAVAALSKALGLPLPRAPKTSETKGSRVALWLGPDEWLVIDEGAKDPLEACARVKGLHSAATVSHRNVAISVTGPGAAAVVNAGCPQDLSLQAFPVGACSRTILGKVEIVLLRTAQDAFRIECWRSFSDYVFTFLCEAARDEAS
ncbi:sarcosine oxidase subunit gamma [Mesorhizobium sp. ZMM04-5]|uniref:Sarcosine oxidase subunit gamma n=1 Tax=Mesorhizobium marinum TaxID=3228790 RepID=A0ABV3QWP5_9HYPH